MKTLAFALAAFAGLAATPAQAQDKELTGEQVSAMIRFAMPTLLDTTYTKCGNRFAADGYMRSNRTALTAKFTAGSQAYWPAAKSGLESFAGDDAGLFGAMPDDALQPFVLAMIGQMVAKEIKPDNCGTIENIMRELDPMPADNVARLIGTIYQAASNGKAPRRG
ncbi:hypothetical protein VCJ71_02235 [Alteriqipengyuania sp. WL0013]|uniref:hypothetical protein n=1 Tax=Alteriqipengyuania sp. WL0013 TaxID=3110773 RepID=UPI002C1C53F5|nr:hypothetical protein [Alteriqipengyuania sp. WL0013]MEB3414878.1 hypothetical protein [Alteriqipengyuania sp. WL0013]